MVVVPRTVSSRAQRRIFYDVDQGSLAALKAEVTPLRMTLFFGLFFAATSVSAADGIDIRRGADSLVYGNCVPSLMVENRSAETIDYLEVDIAVVLGNGQEHTVELKSAYREGVLYPIVPGGTAILRQHLDTSRAIGVPCGELAARKVVRTICEAAGGKACTTSVSVEP
jgi:hypothetical protein